MEKAHKILLTAVAAQTVLLAALILGLGALIVKPVVKTVVKVEKVLLTPTPTPKLLVTPKVGVPMPVASKGATVK